jgi:D-methionine transport system ATP-binding protein
MGEEKGIRLVGVSKKFHIKSSDIAALQDINLTIEQGDILGIIGKSGAGKSTLARCINLLERPDTGQVFFDGCDLMQLNRTELSRKRKSIGMIFQRFNLLMQKNALENVCFPLRLAGVSKKDAKVRAREMLDLVGITEKETAYPAQLSGGQMQRVAIARALSTNPEVLLCDEATSALDKKTTNDILKLLKEINSQFGITIILITHELSVVQKICTKMAVIEEGKIVEYGDADEIFRDPKSEAAKELILFREEE